MGWALYINYPYLILKEEQEETSCPDPSLLDGRADTLLHRTPLPPKSKGQKGWDSWDLSFTLLEGPKLMNMGTENYKNTPRVKTSA